MKQRSCCDYWSVEGSGEPIRGLVEEANCRTQESVQEAVSVTQETVDSIEAAQVPRANIQAIGASAESADDARADRAAMIWCRSVASRERVAKVKQLGFKE